MVHEIDKGDIEFHANAAQLNGLEKMFRREGYVELHLALEDDQSMQFMYDITPKGQETYHISVTANKNDKPGMFRCTIDASQSIEANEKLYSLLHECNLAPKYTQHYEEKTLGPEFMKDYRGTN